MATDSNEGGSAVLGEKNSNGFCRLLENEFIIDSPPPRSTMQGSTRILRKRNGSLFIGKPLNSNAIKARAYLSKLLSPYRPLVPYQFPISIEVDYNFAFNKTEKKANIKKGIIPHYKRPDSDNMMKGLFDVMSSLKYWKDDSQLCEIKFGKYFSSSPSILVKIYSIKYI